MRPPSPSRQRPRREIVRAGRRPIAPRLPWPGKTRGCAAGVFVLLLAAPCFAQDKGSTPAQPGTPAVNVQLPVNWLYGAYIPKDAPIVPLTGKQRFKLYVRQT